MLKFRKSVILFKINNYEKFGQQFVSKIYNHLVKSEYVCKTCVGYLKKGKIPILCLSNGLEFPLVPPITRKLTNLEERLVCTRLPFLRITSLGVD